MSTRRETILAAVKTALTSISGVADASVYRSRAQALTRADSPAVVLEPVSDQCDNPTLQRLIWTHIFQVIVVVRSDTPDQTADPILKDIHGKIMQSATLDALAVLLLPLSVTWTIDDADKSLCMAVMQFRIDYQTSLTDISTT